MGLLDQLDITYCHAVPLCSHKGSEMGNSYFKKVCTRRDQRGLTWSRAGWGSCRQGAQRGKPAGGCHPRDGGPHPVDGGPRPGAGQGGGRRARSRAEGPAPRAGGAAGAGPGGRGAPLPTSPALPASPRAGQGPRAPSPACQQGLLWF